MNIGKGVVGVGVGGIAGSVGYSWSTIVMIVVAVALIIGVATFIIRKSRLISTPSNITRITQQQQAILEGRYSGYPFSRKGLADAWTMVENKEKDGIVPSDQRMLMNTHVFASRLTGALGPHDNGVFSEDRAVRLALQSGARLLVVEIDKMADSWKPCLSIRDSAGYVRSLNSGSIRKVAESIAGRAFSMVNDSVPPAVANDPLLVFVYFRSIPNPIKEKDKYVGFLGDVAEQLQPLQRILLGNTPSGSYRRQARERDIWFQRIEDFRNTCILLCNVDTSVQRSANMPASRDLDGMVHARVYSLSSGSSHGATSEPGSSVKPAVVVTDPEYWLNTPDNKIGDALLKTREMYVITMRHNSDGRQLSAKQMSDLVRVYGVHALPCILFDDEAYTKLWLTEDKKAGSLYRLNSWVAKLKDLRYIPPPVVVSLKQNPKVNTNMGAGAGVLVLK